MIARSLATFLRNNAAITAVTTTIEPVVLSSGHTYPAITYSMEDDEFIRTINASASIKTGRATVDCFADRYDDCKSLAAIIIAELHNYAGVFGDHTAERIDITRSLDLFEAPTKLYRVNMAFDIWYT